MKSFVFGVFAVVLASCSTTKTVSKSDWLEKSRGIASTYNEIKGADAEKRFNDMKKNPAATQENYMGRKENGKTVTVMELWILGNDLCSYHEKKGYVCVLGVVEDIRAMDEEDAANNLQ